MSADDAAEPALPAAWYHAAALAEAGVGDAAAAEARLEEGVRAHPRSAPLLGCLAAWRLRQGRHDEALRLAERAAAEDPTLPQPLKVAGDASYRAGRFDAAAEWYARAIQLAPDLGPDVHLKLGNVRLRQGDRDGAAAAWRRALSLQPGHRIARGNLAALGAPAE